MVKNLPNTYSYTTELRDYIDKMPAGSFKDELLEEEISCSSARFSHVRFIGLKLEASLPLIDKMSSDKKKEEVLSETLANWMRYDAPKVKSWVKNSSLSEEKKQELISHCDLCINEE